MEKLTWRDVFDTKQLDWIHGCDIYSAASHILKYTQYKYMIWNDKIYYVRPFINITDDWTGLTVDDLS
jgi:hypothetical protein